MPKAPRALSPERSHRFSTIILPNSPAESSPMTPQSAGPMSPPMSARSFGTFIDSAPSTPAYSPRQVGDEWDQSTIAILRPMSSSSAPSSPTEPDWEMVSPLKQQPLPARKDSAVTRKQLLSSTSLTSHRPFVLSKPAKRTKPAAPTRATTDVAKSPKTNSKEEVLRAEAEVQARKLVQQEEEESAAAEAKSQEATEKPQAEQASSPKTESAPLGKLATRMKSLLRRNTTEKKKEKKAKAYQEVDRLEDVHWSEM